MLALLMALVGCTPPPETTTGRTETDPETETETTGDTAPPDSGTVPTPDLACAALPPPGPFAFASTRIETQEDFDFDATGLLLTQQYSALLGVSWTGQSQIVASDIGPDATGIRTLSTGDVMVAQPSTGALHLVDAATGGSIAFLGGLDFPNGLEATRDGRVFSSETSPTGRIRLIDPYDDEIVIVIVGQVDSPNNMALSPDEQVLYVLLMNPSGYNLSLSGEVFRIRAADQEMEFVARLPDGGSWSSLRFSPGFGDWSRQQLYATNRSRLFRIEVGIDGRHVLASGR